MQFSLSKLYSKQITIPIGLVAIVALTWGVLYLRHYQEIIELPSNLSSTPVTLRETFTQFDEYIRPILEKKCSACHTNTKERPFFYYIPFVDYISKPYMDNKIMNARREFDFSEGIPRGRLGASMEMVLRLRQVM